MEYLLSKAPLNKPLCIKNINITNLKLARRFADIGLFCGQKISVLGAPTKHNLLVNVRGSVFVIDVLTCSMVVVYD